MTRPSDEKIWSVLNGDASADISAEVAEWLSGEEGLRWIEEHTPQIYAGSENTAPAYDIPSERMLKEIHARIDRSSKKKKRFRTVWHAAAVLVPALLIISAWASIDSKLGNVLFAETEIVSESAKTGEKKELIFQDGTRIRLNAGAQVSYPKVWSLKRRDFSLEGEAFFEVEKNPKRPFVVDIYGTKVKVFGTKFNIKAYPEDSTIDIVLINGKVVFEAGDTEYTMSPAEMLSYNKMDNSIKVTSLEKPEAAISWTENMIVFRNDGLGEVSKILSRWYGVEFEIKDSDLLSRKFTFRTEERPLTTILREMEYISDLKFTMDGNTVTVSKK